MKIIFWALLVFLTSVVEGFAGPSHEGGHNGLNFLPVIFQIINFFLFLLVLYKWALPRTKTFFTKRSQDIQQSLKEAEKAKNLAEKRLKEYKEKLFSIDKEVENIRRLAEKEGRREKAKIITEAEKEAETIKKQAKAIAQQEIKKAKEELRREVVKLSLEKAEKTIKDGINKNDQARLIKEYIKQINPQSC